MRSKPDHYTQRAKKEGYPARSVYKLQELDQKLKLLPKSGRILDVGAAPGSWSLYAERVSKGRIQLVAIDLKPIEAGLDPAASLILQGDVFDEAMQDELASRAPYKLIMSDAAPATTGNRTIDCGRSFSLVEGIIGLIPLYLAPDGNFIAKIFQGGKERNLLSQLQELFSSAKMIKPKACRSESFETFLIGIGYRGKS
jgi:23S rRNA (uridine2552-2'-O)-methyltransferase